MPANGADQARDLSNWVKRVQVGRAARALVGVANREFISRVVRISDVNSRSKSSDTSFAGELTHTLAILRALGISDGFCVDAAASNGVDQSSTLSLFKADWAGLAIEMDPWKFAILAFIYRDFPKARLARSRITPMNIARLLGAYEVPTNFDFLNLDIDSYDLSVLLALLEGNYRPAVISMEINEKIPPGVYFNVLYADDHVYEGDHFYGCSLAAAAKEVRPYGYLLESLVANNAFFVRSSLAGPEMKDTSVEEAYQAGYLDLPSRLESFPWNENVEFLQNLDPPAAVNEIARYFKDYEGRFEIWEC